MSGTETKTENPRINHDDITEEERKILEDSGIFDVPLSFRTLPVIHPIPGSKKKSPKDFEYAEHSFLGDTIKLKLTDGSSKTALDFPLTFYDGLSLTYGQINGLAGDFYGTYDPICQGDSPKDQQNRFRRAYDTLADKSSRQPAECHTILGYLREEVEKVNAAIRNGVDPSTVYHDLPDQTLNLQAATLFRPDTQPSYLVLASLNLDHFGADARTAYNAGHAVALELAQQGNLYGAYKINAFADHFLEDSFSAGHCRTPRRMLSGNKIKDLCSKYMHDEDNAIGLNVENTRGDKWRIYGDKRLADNVDKTNLQLCKEAVQASADEIYDCYTTKSLPTVDSYRVWKIAPTLASAAGHQDCCPLFRYNGKEERRKDINVRRNWAFSDDFWYATTLTLLVASSRWNYPISLNP